MNKLILCTTGTSIANQCPTQRTLIREKTSWDDNVENLKEEICQFIKTTPDIRKISAETNSLDRIGIESSDIIVLLSSDSAPGRCCSECLKDVLMKHYSLKSWQVEIRRIEGLQVRDAKQLREVGLKNFIKVVLEYLNNIQYQYSYETIINPTGGFKGVLPFLTILGMLYGKKTVYIFEFSEELIHLPPLPFSFNLKVYERVKPALDFINENVAVSEQAFLAKIIGFVPSEKDLFMSFAEPFDEGLVTISPLAYCLLSIDSEAESVMICEQAKKKLSGLKEKQSIILQRMISNTSNPLWRNSHLEHWHSTDLLVLKRARSSERIAGFIKEGTFYITNVFTDHDEYERVLSNYSKKDFDKSNFSTYTFDVDLGFDDDSFEGVSKERDSLLVVRDKLNEQLKKQSEEIDNFKKVIEDIKASHQSSRESLEEVIESKNNRIKELENSQKIEKDKGLVRFLKNLFKMNNDYRA